MDMQDLYTGTLDDQQGILHADPVQVVSQSLLTAQNHVSFPLQHKISVIYYIKRSIRSRPKCHYVTLCHNLPTGLCRLAIQPLGMATAWNFKLCTLL